MEEYKPFLMWDDSKKDGHAETIMDYVISWCLRCTMYPFIKDNKPILYQYCKYMLCKLIDRLQDMNNIEIDNVRVRKQEHRIDLWVEIELRIDKRQEKHAILIEDKYYTLLRENQLENYKPIFADYYQNKQEKYQLHYALITCLYDDHSYYNVLAQSAEKNGFNIYHLYELADSSLGYKESESDIYNELFLKNWL